MPATAAAGIALALGLIVAALALHVPHPIRVAGVAVGDIAPPMLGFERFLHGLSPYGIRVASGVLAAYPFTTMLLLAPLRFVPLPFVAPLFCGLSTAILAFGLLRSGPPWRLLMLLSVPFLAAVHSVQWSPLFTAAILLPPLLPLAVVKPQLGLVVLACGSWTRWTAAAAAGILLLSLILLPAWPLLWLSEGGLGSYEGRSPFSVAFGFVLLLSALLWRTANGRLLLVMSLVAQRYFYDQLLLFLIPRTWRQMVTMIVLSWAAAGIAFGRGWWDPQSGEQEYRTWVAVVGLIYVPALALVAWQERHRLRRSGQMRFLK